MAKSKWEAMEDAIKEKSRIAATGVSDKVRIESLTAEIESIDADTAHAIEEIRAAPIDKELLKRQAAAELKARQQKNARVCNDKADDAEQRINEAEHMADHAYKSAKLEIEKQRKKLASVRQAALEQKERDDIAAQQEYDAMLANINNAEKSVELQIKRATLDGERKKQELKTELRELQAKNSIVEELAQVWQRFYDDVVVIAKAPPRE